MLGRPVGTDALHLANLLPIEGVCARSRQGGTVMPTKSRQPQNNADRSSHNKAKAQEQQSDA